MTTIKSFTDLEQSKKLAEILPLESADMWWLYVTSQGKHIAMMYEEPDPHYIARMESYGIKDAAIRCWSLSALLDMLPYPTLYQQGDGAWGLDVWVEQVKPYSVNNAICRIDACYEMILKLHELNLL